MTSKKLDLRAYAVGRTHDARAVRPPRATREHDISAGDSRSRNLHTLYLATKLPWDFWMAVAELGGAALPVCLVLELQRNLERTSSIKPRRYLMGSLGIMIGAETRALRKLEVAGLVRVDRRSGQRPLVTPLWGAHRSSKGEP
jgi:DNA-binding transcriptional ArsR family regulator